MMYDMNITLFKYDLKSVHITARTAVKMDFQKYSLSSDISR